MFVGWYIEEIDVIKPVISHTVNCVFLGDKYADLVTRSLAQVSISLFGPERRLAPALCGRRPVNQLSAGVFQSFA